MVKKSADTLRLAEQRIIESMTDAEIDAILAENPDPKFQAMLEDMTDAEIDACIAGDTSPLIRRGWPG
jgi:hypothetical protein